MATEEFRTRADGRQHDIITRMDTGIGFLRQIACQADRTRLGAIFLIGDEFAFGWAGHSRNILAVQIGFGIEAMIGIGPEIEGDAARYIDAGRIAFGIGGRIVGEFGFGIDAELFTRCRARTLVIIRADN